MSDFPGLVSKRSARTFYNVADALRPPEAGHAGAGDVDLVPALTAHLRWQGVGAARRFFCILFLIEWLSALGSGRGRRFWRLPRAERQRHLERWRTSRLRLRRESLEWLEALVDEARSDAAASD